MGAQTKIPPNSGGISKHRSKIDEMRGTNEERNER